MAFQQLYTTEPGVKFNVHAVHELPTMEQVMYNIWTKIMCRFWQALRRALAVPFIWVQNTVLCHTLPT